MLLARLGWVVRIELGKNRFEWSITESLVHHYGLLACTNRIKQANTWSKTLWIDWFVRVIEMQVDNIFSLIWFVGSMEHANLVMY